MKKSKNPVDDLEILFSKSNKAIEELLAAIAMAFQLGKKGEEQKLSMELGELIKKASFYADLLGRKRALEQVSPAREELFEFAEKPINSNNFSLEQAFDLPFDDAIKTVMEWEIPYHTQQKVYDDLYKKYGPNVNPLTIQLAKEQRENAMIESNKIVLKDLREGIPRAQVEKQLKKNLAEWSDGQASSVYRNMIASAYSAGMWRQLSEPTIKQFVGGLIFETAGDSDVRPEHKVLDGKIWKVNNPIWNQIAPPIYYNCRCGIRFLSHEDLKNMNRLDSNGNLIEDNITPDLIPQNRFAIRPDLSIYKGTG